MSFHLILLLGLLFQAPSFQEFAMVISNDIKADRIDLADEHFQEMYKSALNETKYEFLDTTLFELCNIRNLDTVLLLKWSKIAMDYYVHNNDFLNQARLLIINGLHNRRNGKYQACIAMLDQGEHLIKSLQTETSDNSIQKQLARIYGNRGGTFRLMGKYPAALKNLFQLDSIAAILNDTILMMKAQLDISSVYQNIGSSTTYFIDSTNSKDWIEKGYQAMLNSQRLRKLKRISLLETSQLSGIGLFLLEKGELQAAVDTLLKVIEIQNEKSDFVGLANSWNLLGNGYVHQKKYPKAVHAFNQTKYFGSKSSKRLVVTGNLNLSRTYFKQGNHLQALQFGQEALSLLNDYYEPKRAFLIHQNLAEIFEQTGDFAEALKHQKQFNEIEKSMFNTASSDQFNELRISYEALVNESKIKDLESMAIIQKAKISKQRIYLFASLLSALLLFSFGALYFQRQQAAKQQKLLELKNQILRAQMNPHFIFNSLASIQGSLHEKETPKFIAKLSKLMRQVLELNRHESITLFEEISFIETYLEVQKKRKSFNYTIAIDESIDQKASKVPPMIVQPFLENAVEYGLAPEQKNIISIKINPLGKNCLKIMIKDNGPGFQNHSSEHTSLATKITKERLASLQKKTNQKASLKIIEGEGLIGVEVQLQIPIESVTL